MNRVSIVLLMNLLGITVCAAPPATAPAQMPTPSPAPTGSASVSAQEMLVNGPPQLKMHALVMLVQGQIAGPIDETYLPGLKACAENPGSPLRSMAAQLLGRHFVEGKENPNPIVIELLKKLAMDESADVRYSAIYYGLTQIPQKSDAMISLLIELAGTNRKQSLCDRIAESLEPNREQVVALLDAKLAEGDNISIYEIYEDFTGKKPKDAEKYLEMPSSRPRMFILRCENESADAAKAELEKEMKSAGIETPHVKISETGPNFVLMAKTYLTRDREIIEALLADHETFKIIQDLWLTPELELQMDALSKK